MSFIQRWVELQERLYIGGSTARDARADLNILYSEPYRGDDFKPEPLVRLRKTRRIPHIIEEQPLKSDAPNPFIGRNQS